ncbi:MAG: AraC family transcriptional regulator [Lachnospiraceae bacterium]|nr:AraC family transcriptional regulator [Lachnospiraceae bacterium]
MSNNIIHERFQYQENEAFVVKTSQANLNYENDERVMSHWHEELEIVYMVNFGCSHYVEGRCVKSEPGDLVVVNPGAVHSINVHNSHITDDGLGSIILLIHPQFLQKYFPQYQMFDFTNEHMHLGEEVDHIMFQLARYTDRSEKTEYDHLYGEGLVMQILYYICQTGIRKKEKRAGQVSSGPIKEILAYIQSHYDEPLNQDDIAEMFYISKSYFYKYFKRWTGLGFSQYVTQYRVEQARLAMINSEETIQEIAWKS